MLWQRANSSSKWRMKSLSKKLGTKIVWTWQAECVMCEHFPNLFYEKVTVVKWNYLNLRTKLHLPGSKRRPGAPTWITFWIFSRISSHQGFEAFTHLYQIWGNLQPNKKSREILVLKFRIHVRKPAHHSASEAFIINFTLLQVENINVMFLDVYLNLELLWQGKLWLADTIDEWDVEVGWWDGWRWIWWVRRDYCPPHPSLWLEWRGKYF